MKPFIVHGSWFMVRGSWMAVVLLASSFQLPAAFAAEERVEEIARMLGGAGDPVARRHAREMLRKVSALVG